MNTEELNRFAETVRSLRGDKSRRDFARLVGVSAPLISIWEKAGVEPSYESLEKVARLRGQSLKEFMDDLQQKPFTENQEPFDKWLERLPQVIKALPDKDLAALMEAIAYGLKLR